MTNIKYFTFCIPLRDTMLNKFWVNIYSSQCSEDSTDNLVRRIKLKFYEAQIYGKSKIIDVRRLDNLTIWVPKTIPTTSGSSGFSRSTHSDGLANKEQPLRSFRLKGVCSYGGLIFEYPPKIIYCIKFWIYRHTRTKTRCWNIGRHLTCGLASVSAQSSKYEF